MHKSPGTPPSQGGAPYSLWKNFGTALVVLAFLAIGASSPDGYVMVLLLVLAFIFSGVGTALSQRKLKQNRPSTDVELYAASKTLGIEVCVGSAGALVVIFLLPEPGLSAGIVAVLFLLLILFIAFRPTFRRG